MAIDQARSQSPLGFMSKLSETVFIHEPAQHDSSKEKADGSQPPSLILVLGWVAAREVHLAKYVREHQTRSPTSRILLIKAQMAAVAFPNIARADVAAAIPPIHDILSETQVDRPQLLIHAFSNGGSCLLSTLYTSYLEKYGSPLPLHVTIFDSAPSMHYNRRQAVIAITAGVPRGIMYVLTLPIVHILSLFWVIRIYILRLPDRLTQLAVSHNDKATVRETRRLYIYSDVDVLIDKESVEQHALDARQRGFTVSKEMFKGSPHVAHARSDGERYWKIIDDAWAGRSSALSGK